MKNNDQIFLAQKIRSSYAEREHTELDELKAADRKATRPAYIFTYVFGILAALIMGSGMSLVMTEIGAKLGIQNGMVPGIIIGSIGLLMTLINYPIFKRFLAARCKKYEHVIFALSDNIIKGEE